MQRLRIVLAEDHETVREGLRLLLETRGGMEVVRTVSDGRAAVEAATALSPDVAVLDLSMPGMSGLAATRAIKEQAPTVAVVVLTRHAEPAYVKELLGAGAAGYVLKQSPFDELLRAVRAASNGDRYVDRAAIPGPVNMMAAGTVNEGPPPTEREMTVLRLAALGHSNKEIASTLHIAVKTVEVHKANVMRKLGLHDRAEILRFAVVNGWLADP
jgi:DNA-binding NarL/FixJ family response regulator